MKKNLLEIKELKVYFYTDDGVIKAIDGVSFDICRGRIVGLVGESGCGKSVTARSILRIIPPPGRIVTGEILYRKKNGGSTLDLARLDPKGKEIRSVRGKVISMIFQEPMTCLSPVHTIGNQIMESILLHEKGIKKSEARDRVIELLREVGMSAAEKQVDAYSFELSGGMRQRAMIAVALSARPEFLIADEPTTAVDVTIQAKVIDLLKELQTKNSMSILYITHDLGVIAEISDDVVVMYLGKIVEKGTVLDVYDRPKHPYTQSLLQCIPRLSSTPKKFLATIKGGVPGPYSQPQQGCLFNNRCPQFMKGICDRSMPSLVKVEKNHQVACFLHKEESEE